MTPTGPPTATAAADPPIEVAIPAKLNAPDVADAAESCIWNFSASCLVSVSKAPILCLFILETLMNLRMISNHLKIVNDF